MHKKRIIFLCLYFFLSTSLFAQKYNYSDSWGAQGFNLESADAGGVTLTFSVREFSLNSMDIDGEAFNQISLPGTFLPNNAGAPDLPGQGRYIAVPRGASVTYQITGQRVVKLSGLNIAPARRIPKEDEPDFPYQKDAGLYQSNTFYPSNPVIVSRPEKIRGVDVVMLGITPFQYNPVSKELIVYRDLRVEIRFSGGDGNFGEDRLRSRWWDPILQDALLNSSSLPEVTYPSSRPDSDTPDYEYLIICPNDNTFLAWADTIKNWRTLQGIRTGVVTTTALGGNTSSAIETYINSAYNTWAVPPAAVLILGDYGISGNTVDCPTYNSYCVSDNIYADVDGNHLPDIALARITAQNATNLSVMIGKFLSYERQPPTSANFYSHPITAMGYQTERWFQLCSEVVNGFFQYGLGKQPVRENAIYSGTPGGAWSSATNTSTVVNYFGPSGLNYIPSNTAHLTDWGGNATRINNDINSGAFILSHRDHGGETGWGEPSYSNSSLTGLNNTYLPFVFSLNCLTGKFNYSGECFAEAFHRMQKGALGLIAATEVSYSFVNDALTWGMYDYMWPNFMPAYGSAGPVKIMPAFANVSGKYFLQQSSWPYNTGDKEVTYYLFHHHGDAFLTVYSEVPQYLTVVHDATILGGATSVTVNANAGSLIALTCNGQILGVATGTGAPLGITIPSQTPGSVVRVTVTKQNYYRYSSNVLVISPTGAYVVQNAVTLNDAGGNNNGLLDYGEPILLSLTVKNMGSSQASNVSVKVTTTDPYVTMTDSTQSYGSIAANSTASVSNGFAFNTAWNIPDNHVVNFTTVCSDGTNTWTSFFSITGHAPAPAYLSNTISDPSGNNNGKLDPGETASVSITLKNNGSASCSGITATLSASDPYLTISGATQTYGTLASGASSSQPFSLTVASGTPQGHVANFTVQISAVGGITATGNFSVVIGQIPVLVLDLDPNHSSGPAIQAAIEANNVAVEYATSFPASLSLYNTLFVCLGIYSNNHVLTTAEGSTLASFVNAGGKIYMEGGDTWYYDAQTTVHPLFKITASSDGSSDLATVSGQTGTLTAGMSFTYSGENNWIDRIGPTSGTTAYTIFTNSSPSYGTAVAYAGSSYKSIGASHEFTGLTNGSAPSTKNELMRKYLEFFNLTSPAVTANFSANQTSVCQGSTVSFTSSSTGPVTSWNWSFPGGSPATSTLSNPMVTYSTPGTYNVSLTVSSGSSSNTLTKSNYITVNASAPVSLTISPNPSGTICAGTSVTFTATPVNGGTSPTYQWKLNGSNAGTNSPAYTNAALANGDAVTCLVTSNAACATGSPATSNTITMAVNQTLPVSVTISPGSGTSICAGVPVTFTASPVNGGTAPSYQWKLNGLNVGTNSPAWSSSSLANGNTVTCVMTSNAACTTGNPATSNAVMMSVSQYLPASVSISTVSPTTICAGTNVTFTASPVNAGTSPSYQWKLNNSNVGANSPSWSSSALTNGSSVTCIMTSSLACATGNPATSNAIPMTVIQNQPVSVTITADPAGTVCSGTEVTFTAYPVNGGTAPSYQWKIDGVSAGANSQVFSTSSLANGSTVSCIITSGLECTSGNPATSNAIIMNVSENTPVGVTISASPSGTVCKGTLLTFTAAPLNGGTSPNYEWKVNGITAGNGQVFTTGTLLDNDAVVCNLTSNMTGCLTNNPAVSNQVHVDIDPLPVADAGSDLMIPYNSSTLLFGIASAGSGNYAYQWSPASLLVDPGVQNPSTVVLTENQDFTLQVRDLISGCLSLPDEVSVTLEGIPLGITGQAIYDNTASTPLAGIEIVLNKDGLPVNSAITGTNGSYLFNYLEAGDYYLSAICQKPWGGVNSSDALLVMRYFTGIVPLEGLRLQAADVDGTGFVNSLDALSIAKRYVGNQASFVTGDWIFDTPFTLVSNPGTILNMKGLCVGDVNGSHVPSARKVPAVYLAAREKITVTEGDLVDIPVISEQDLFLGSVSLEVNYPPYLLDICSVRMNPGQEANLLYHAGEGILRISWYNTAPLQIHKGEPVFFITAKPKSASTSTCVLSTAAESEFTDPSGHPIEPVYLSAPKLGIEGRSGVACLVYPNPFTTIANFQFNLPLTGKFRLELYTSTGDLIYALEEENAAEGLHQVRWDGYDRSGKKAGERVYTYRLVTDQAISTGKLTLIP